MSMNDAMAAEQKNSGISSKVTTSLTGVLLLKDRSPWFFIDLLIGVGFFVLFGWLSPHSNYIPLDQIRWAALIFSVFYGFSALGVGLYERENRFSIKSCAQLGVMAGLIAFVITQALIYFVLYWRWSLGRYLLVYGSVGSYLGIFLFHGALSFALKKLPHRFVILGDPSPITDDIKKFCDRARGGVHYMHADSLQGQLTRAEVTPAQMSAAIFGSQILDIVLTENARKNPKLIEVAMRGMQVGCRVIDEIHFYSEIFECFPSKVISENWLVLSGIDTHKNLTNLAKRLFDILFSTIALILLSPLLILTGVLIKLTSRGPVLFIQDRQGRFGEPFRIFKFRTMAVDIDVDNPPSTRANDPRVIAIGKLLRPLHLDELPQLWNIFKGDMSFVGPRPEVYSFTQEIVTEVPIYKFRCLMRPGLTGLSQISVGYTLDNSEATLVKMAYDLYYIKNHSFFLDLLIILRTAFLLTRNVH